MYPFCTGMSTDDEKKIPSDRLKASQESKRGTLVRKHVDFFDVSSGFEDPGVARVTSTSHLKSAALPPCPDSSIRCGHKIIASMPLDDDNAAGLFRPHSGKKDLSSSSHDVLPQPPLEHSIARETAKDPASRSSSRCKATLDSMKHHEKLHIQDRSNRKRAAGYPKARKKNKRYREKLYAHGRDDMPHSISRSRYKYKSRMHSDKMHLCNTNPARTGSLDGGEADGKRRKRRNKMLMYRNDSPNTRESFSDSQESLGALEDPDQYFGVVEPTPEQDPASSPETMIEEIRPGAFTVSRAEGERRLRKGRLTVLRCAEQSREGAIAGRSGPRSKRMSKTAMPQQSNREINPYFQDVKNTGKWGTLSRREFYLVLGLAVAVIIAIILVVVVLVTGNNGNPSEPPPRPPPPTDSPTQAPTRAPIIDVATSLRDAIGNLSSISGTLADLPEDETFYVALHEDSTQPANVRAMSWILYADPSEPGPSHPHLAERYALATLFYATGEDWIDTSQWITEASICTWAGLFCDVQERLVELDLSSNGLKNELPNEIALLQHVRAFSVRHNRLTGPIPALAFHDMPELSILYLDNNMFTGELDNVLSEGVLSVLFTQENNFTKGFFPIGFCVGNSLSLDKAGLDCDVTRCLCCNPTQHCL